MEHVNGRIVRACAGRDKDGLFFVIGADGGYLLLADGKRRKAARPKRKRSGHVEPVDMTGFEHPVIGKLNQSEPVTDRELRRALAAFKEGITRGER